MKYMFQFMRIAVVALIGELLNQFLPFPIPASVYGLVLMLVCLFLGIIKVDQVEETANWLVNTISVIVMVSSISLMTILGRLVDILPLLFLASIVTTLVVMIVTGKTAQWILERKSPKGVKKEEEPDA